MVNISNVAQASALLVTDTVLASQGEESVDASMKASWEVMVQGTFSLLFPEIHKVFPTRLEMEYWLREELDVAFQFHHGTNMHQWSATPTGPGNTAVLPCEPVTVFPQENLIMKMTRATQTTWDVSSVLGDDYPDVEIATPEFQYVTVWSLSPANALLAA